MSLINYYDALFENEKLNSEYVTYLSAIHMMNTISKRDNINNKILKDLGMNYSKKALVFYENAQAPLTFLNDDIQVIYDFTKEHINKILKKPHAAIVKEQKLIKKEKIKSLEPKSLRWLADKPGSSVREKLTNVNKISSTVKRYSYNIKENQVLLAYFKDISKILNKKINIMNSNPELFGPESLELEILKRELNKKNFTFKTEFEEVIEKDYSTPNNALIGNVDYSSVWCSYLDLKQKNIDYSNAFNDYKKSFINMLISYLMNYYDFIEDINDSSSLCNYILYSDKGDELQEILFENNEEFKIKINTFSTQNSVELLSSNEFVFKFKEIENDNNRGLPYNLYVNDKLVGKFYSDILGFKEVIPEILKELDLVLPNLKEQSLIKNDYNFISINSFDNRMYSNSDSIRLGICDNGNTFNNNSICFANNKNLYYSSYKKDNYSRFLRHTSSFNGNISKNIIYDINDTFDEFSSAVVRRTYSSVYPKSYPVWRSILAGESAYNKDNVKTILDFCGKNFSVSKLERKENRFVHCGPVEVPIYYQIFNEFNFYESYINKYQKKYNISYTNNVINEFMSSGALHSILNKKLDKCIVCDGTIINHDYYAISFDDELFEETLTEFDAAYSVIIEKYDKKSTISIFPDFLELLVDKYRNIICNKYLITGANEIIQRLKNNEITWYEKLPKLSLEIIRDGMFDNLVLVDNQECENIIGKKFNIKVNDILTLSKGNKNYILPLNKSFIGAENDFFVAKAEDPSFPLEEDVDVKLIIEYSFGTENSYLLKLIPVSKTAPFEEIIINWEKEESNNILIYPKIDKKYSSDNFENEISLFRKNCEYVDKSCYLLKQKNFFGKNKMIYDDIRKNTYIHQNVTSSTGNASFFAEIIKETNYVENLRYLHNLMLNNYEKETEPKYKQISQWNIEDIECALIEILRKGSIFKSGYLKFPTTCYGWYFAHCHDDLEVINDAYSSLIEMSEVDNYLSSQKIRMHFQALTGAATTNYMMPYDIAKSNTSYIKYLLKVIIKIMKEMSEYDYLTYSDDKNNNPKENALLMRYCVEILISFLFVRNMPQFDELKPSGIYSKEIIYCLKKFNRKYREVNDWYGKEPNMKTKYNMSFDNMPSELNNILPEIYCLILYLSGDERANYIKIGSGA